MKGLNKKWTDWNEHNNMLDFPFLPTGNYLLEVQSRDLFGNISQISPLAIKVIPPFWRSAWFYGMEFSIFSLLVLLSFKLSVKYRIISRLLSLFSIILLIEFIQTIVGMKFSNSSPLINFFIQVFVAFVILPVEEFLRNTMFRSIDATSKMYKIAREDDKKDKHEKLQTK